MFRTPFSFSGRIRRLEFGLTYIFYFLVIFLGVYTISEFSFLEPLFALIFILSYWVLLAQGAKRCHDLSNSGFYQLIPFYILMMFFAEGDKKENKYGISPKSNEYLKKENQVIILNRQKISHQNVLESIFVSLLLALVLGINNLVFVENDTYQIISYFIAPIPGFYLLLFISYYRKSFSGKKIFLMTQRLVFTFVYFLIIRFYGITFRLADFNLNEVPYEILAIGFIFGLTYIPFKAYSLIFKSKPDNV